MTAKTALFLTEAQVADRIGLSTDQYKTALPALSKIGFPQPDPLFADRRYWPAIQAFLDRRAGLATGSDSAIPARDEEEPWKRKKSV